MEDTGSFRDRTSRIFYHEGHVYRGLSQESLQVYRKAAALPFFSEAQRRGELIGTEEVPLDSVPASAGQAGWAGILRHDRIPCISYPYEWCFSMLQDAALLHLDLLIASLQHDLILKDSSAYNIQFANGRPIFIDIGSFQTLKPGEPWIGYRQFCQMFLFPLMLQAYKQVPFQNWLRSALDGIEINDLNAVMSLRDLFRPGVFKHVFLHSKLQSQHAGSRRNVRSELQTSGFSKELILINARNLRALVGQLTAAPLRSAWVDYATRNSYSELDTSTKRQFIEHIVAGRRRRLVWDLGSNTGLFSQIAAAHAETVVAMDSDPHTVERLYRELKGGAAPNILPLVMNLANPSPNQGWHGLERRDLISRGRPELILALALIHHMVISANIPLAQFVQWLANLGADLVLEFVSKKDPMVQALLANKEDQYTDYDQEILEGHLNQHFTIEQKRPLACGSRVLYYCSQRRRPCLSS